jgi:transcriptional regulator with XRE-family HTH domain
VGRKNVNFGPLLSPLGYFNKMNKEAPQMMDPIILDNLNQYLDSTRLSMNQVAGKWGVSAPLLSQIRNGKKGPGVELGLRILREAGADLETRKKWLENKKGNGDEVSKVYEDSRKERVEHRLQKNFCEHLEFNPILMDLFLDISLMKTAGFSWSGVLKNYGEYGLSQVQFLIDSGLVRKEDDRYFIVQDKLPHAMNSENSFGLMEAIFEVLKQKVKKEEFQGEFHFDIVDVSPEGYEKLKDLNIEFTKKMISVLKECEMPRLKGGKRIVAQNLVGVLKTLIVVMLVGLFGNDHSYAQGSGLTGGASGKFIAGDSMAIDMIDRAGRTSFTYGRTPRDITVSANNKREKIQWKPINLATPEFTEKEEALKAAVRLNDILKNGGFSRSESRSIVQKYRSHCHTDGHTSALKRIYQEISKGGVKPVGFKVIESYSPEGTPRFRAVGNYLAPCLERD